MDGNLRGRGGRVQDEEIMVDEEEVVDEEEEQDLWCVWCEDWSISLPKKIEALSGSCVTINCRFDINSEYDKDLTDSAAGVWLKDGTDIEGNGGLKWTYTQKSAFIDVIDFPPNPAVQMFEDQMEVEEEVLEGSSMCLRCSAKTLCSSSPPTLTWSSTDRLHLNESSRLQLDQQNQTEIISDLNFTATHLQHGVTFICTITYQLQQRKTTALNFIRLRVQYGPKISLFSCNRTNVTVCLCEAHGNPSPKVEWFLSGRPVSNSANTSISEERLSSTDLRSFISLHQSLTHTDTLQCVTTNTHGNASKQIQLVSSLQEMTHCQLTLIPLLVILTLILILYALTVGFGLYKIRQ
ncbi:uncharacterized protein [Paramisgurnus dabryanus]|uniref:uncharacterized protein n=1 Tax=Paramisgurnus dabryanus TaxID=90735 RepID=UPI003CCF7225